MPVSPSSSSNDLREEDEGRCGSLEDSPEEGGKCGRTSEEGGEEENRTGLVQLQVTLQEEEEDEEEDEDEEEEEEQEDDDEDEDEDDEEEEEEVLQLCKLIYSLMEVIRPGSVSDLPPFVSFVLFLFVQFN